MISETSTNIVLPEDVQSAILSARNNVSLLEAEAGRLERLILSQKRELVSLDGALKDIKEQIDVITENRIFVTREVAVLNESKLQLEQKIREIELSNTKTRAEIDAREVEVSKRESDVAEAERKLQGTELSLSERIKAVEEDEQVIKVKKLTLSEALAQL